MTDQPEKKLSIRSGSKVSFADKDSAVSTGERTNEPTGGLTVTDGHLVSSSPASASPTSGGEANEKLVVTSPESPLEEEGPETEDDGDPAKFAGPEKSRTH